MIHTASTTCTCCSDVLRGQFSRRGFIQSATAGTAALALSPYFAFAAEGKYEALVLSCIDPRTQEGVRRSLVRRGLLGKYSQVIMAGAAIGVVAPAFQDWHKMFWDNLAASVQLHSIKKVIAIDHRDCGAAKIAYGADKLKTRDDETSVHRTALAEFRKQCGERHPKLGIETGLMSLQGRIDRLG